MNKNKHQMNVRVEVYLIGSTIALQGHSQATYLCVCACTRSNSMKLPKTQRHTHNTYRLGGQFLGCSYALCSAAAAAAVVDNCCHSDRLIESKNHICRIRVVYSTCLLISPEWPRECARTRASFSMTKCNSQTYSNISMWPASKTVNTTLLYGTYSCIRLGAVFVVVVFHLVRATSPISTFDMHASTVQLLNLNVFGNEKLNTRGKVETFISSLSFVN